MLVLTRMKGESLVIDGRVKVKVLEVRGDKIRFGIECPDDVTVNREEVEGECNPGWRKAVHQTRTEREE